MIIPPSRIDDDTLTSILEDFITREGTDYGETELSLEQKRLRLRPQIMNGEVLIVFDAAAEALQLISARDYREQMSHHDDGDGTNSNDTNMAGGAADYNNAQDS